MHPPPALPPAATAAAAHAQDGWIDHHDRTQDNQINVQRKRDRSSQTGEYGLEKGPIKQAFPFFSFSFLSSPAGRGFRLTTGPGRPAAVVALQLGN